MDIDALFEELIRESMDELPQDYIRHLNNVAITTADEPDEHQIRVSKLRTHSMLLGLYEGIPLTQRGSGTIMALPDKITLFKKPLLSLSRDKDSLKQHIKRTLWHEIAHYYGLSHDDMAKLQHDDNELTV